MSRTVTALYDTRAEAETACGRLAAEVNAGQVRIIGKDTAGALDMLKIAPEDAKTYRKEVGRGGFLLVAEVAEGQNPERIIRVLEGAPAAEFDTPRAAQPARPAPQPLGTERADAPPMREPLEEERIPRVEEELRIDRRQVERGGARVRSFVREQPTEQEVTLREEHVDIENRPVERRLTAADIEAGGLLKERVFEVSEVREEPVVSKEAVVREEVIVKKTVSERTETIRDTVRHTEIEVEELPESGAGPPLRR
jgi:uncharacterized protein (TIGR02271 family)